MNQTYRSSKCSFTEAQTQFYEKQRRRAFGPACNISLYSGDEELLIWTQDVVGLWKEERHEFNEIPPQGVWALRSLVIQEGLRRAAAPPEAETQASDSDASWTSPL